MMKQSACRQLTEPGFWAGVLVVLCTLSMGADVHQDLKTQSMPSRVLKRHKRDWNWDKLYVSEELPPQNPPGKIGKLDNTFFNTSSRYILSGEGANKFFTVNENGDINVNAKLDREEKSIYKLSASIINKESGKPLDKDETFVIVVLDINDNSPVFPPDLSGSISESSETGSIVMTVNATDADDGSTLNGKIEYKLLNGTDLFYINKKRLDNVGEIRLLKSSLDREKQSQYIIAIQAKDLPGKEIGNSATTTVTININDANDNIATFKKGKYTFNVKEDSKQEYEIGVLDVDDKDEIQNKDPTFTIQHEFDEVFDIKLNNEKDGILTLKVPLDYETRNIYTFHVNVDEHTVSKSPDNQGPNLQKTAEVSINVTDVDEPPVFNQTKYNFSFYEGQFSSPIIGAVLAKDPDKTGNKIRYSIEDSNCPVAVDPVQGHLSVKRQLDREQQSLHTFKVTAHEDVPNGLMSYALVNLTVLDINDNAPEITNGTLHVCESDTAGTIIGTVGANDKDESSQRFTFTLAKKSTNFTLRRHPNNTASIELKHGGFSTESSMKYELEIEIKDGGNPEKQSINLVQIKVCTCHAGRRIEYCKAFAQTGVSASALLAILLCIVTILVIVILIVLRRRYQKEVLVIKSSGDIHEQLVSYDEEGGGEMDTNGYDVSILSSACQDSSFRPGLGPSLYAVVKKPPACKGDMGMMIEVKKDEADHDWIPYDTLHIYGYEGSESLAGSLSSLDSSSSGSNLDYDFLHEWGPRFRTLAQLYGVDDSDTDSFD
ncbi:cadherin-5-like isoform X2 [Carassius auratus]|nr:cadherin-5-like isoform X2 [Carassius auratus]XP_026071242.1 cadherin-5-like isoform X2 [Carassius auratus]XP_026071243.1 cadherin-5-like isoform X2 [Carassius auratus]XP_026071244.1 cadherin-5-like isoform X2 [Carassius auratus]